MLPEEVTKLVGTTGDVAIMEVEKGAIKRYIDAIDDHKLIYWDEEYARNSRHGSIIAPPGFFGWPLRPAHETLASPVWVALADAGYSRVVHGGVETEYLGPIRAGDTLAALTKVVDIYEREGKTGNMAFSITETTYTNQKGELVAKVRNTMIHRFG